MFMIFEPQIPVLGVTVHNSNQLSEGTLVNKDIIVKEPHIFTIRSVFKHPPHTCIESPGSAQVLPILDQVD